MYFTAVTANHDNNDGDGDDVVVSASSSSKCDIDRAHVHVETADLINAGNLAEILWKAKEYGAIIGTHSETRCRGALTAEITL